MKSWFFSSSSCLGHFILSVLVMFDFPLSLGNPDELNTYNTCSKEFSCGNITGVTYPFGGGDRPLGCGLYDLQLHCQDDGDGDGIAAATIEIKGVQYSVLSLNKDAQTLRLARHDYLKGLCSPLLANTTLDSELFDYGAGDYQYITFVYGCPSPLEESLIPYQISCSEAGNPLTGVGYFLAGSQPQGPGECNVSVSFPVLSDLETLLREGMSLFQNLDQIIGEGFEVRLKVNSTACWECLESKGACGYDLVLNQTTCYCKDQTQPSSRTCRASPTDEGPSSPPSPTGEGPSSPESFLPRQAVPGNNGSPETKENSLVVCFGEMLIDFVPTTNGLSLAEAPAFKKAPGGAPANVAVGIARLGGSSAFIGKVGADEFGYMLADILKENNVNNEGMRFDPGARTALAFVTLRKDGEREFMFYRNPSADMLLQESELDFDLIRKAKIFHYGSISLITEPCKSAHLAAAKAAKDAGVIVSYDPNLRLPLWQSADSAREGILSIWNTADIIKMSEEEISFLTKGEDPYDDAVVRKFYHPNLKLLLVTEGPDGCRYYTKDFSGRVKGLKVDAVDTTGAGDAFVAGILSQLAADLSLLQEEDRLRDALKFANACGALTVMERGAIPALPSREAVTNAMLKLVA